MSHPKLIAFAGSTRRGSYNAAVIAKAAASAKDAGASVELLDLRDFELPLFNQDLESEKGLPDAAKRLKQLFKECDGLLISSPEYNSSYPPLLKNLIDRCSRAESDDEAPLSAYAGKSALLLSASPGPLGGLRGLQNLRSLLQNIQVTVYPEMLSVRSASEVIGEDGGIKDERWEKRIAGLVKSYVLFASKLAS